jgi:competence protein ComEC
VGSAALLGRIALGGAGPVAEPSVPDGRGPWTFEVVSVGSPRDGQQTATLRSIDTAAPAFIVAATLPAYPDVTTGDRVTTDGAIRARPDSPYGAYLERIGAVGTLTARSMTVHRPPADPRSVVEGIRQAAATALTTVLPEPEAGLAAGILIGLRDRVDRDVASAFTTAGVSHVVAISGWNIAIVAAVVAAVFGRLRRRRRSVLTMLVIVAYVAFAGASASVVRAGAMAGVVMLARESGRAGRAAAALGWAAVLLLLADPALIRDAGFQLSTLATAGLIAWATPIATWIAARAGGRVPGWLAESLGVSLAAQAATLPVVLASFGRLALLSPVVNLAIVPIVAPAMAAGLVAMVGGFAVLAGAPPIVGAVLAFPAWVSLRLMVGIVDAMAGLPFASVRLDPPWTSVTAVAALAAIALAHRRWSRRRAGKAMADKPAGSPKPADGPATGTATRTARPRVSRHAVLALVVVLGIAGSVIASRPTTVARVSILDVGQGDAILVEGSRGGRLLVDGGPDPGRLLVALDARIPPWDRRIDAVILSHPHEDHVAGLARLLARYHVRQVFEPGMRGPGPGYAAWLDRLAQTGAPARLALAAGDRLRVDDIDLRVLWPLRGKVPPEPPDGGTGINNVSVVLLGSVGTRRFLLAGDVEEAIDPTLLAEGLPRVDLLKVAHHGSRTATTQAFVDTVRPRIAVASAGAGNPYGHPTRATLDRLAAAGARVLRTDEDGTVVVTFDPDGATVRTEGGRTTAAVITDRPAPSSASGRMSAYEPATPRFLCAVPITGLVATRPAAPPSPFVAPASGQATTVRYHRADGWPTGDDSCARVHLGRRRPGGWARRRPSRGRIGGRRRHAPRALGPARAAQWRRGPPGPAP